MNIALAVGDSLMFKFLAYTVKEKFKNENIQVIVENTYSKESFKKQIKFRIKKYGILKFINEVSYRLYERVIQKSNKIYMNAFQPANKLEIDYSSKNLNDKQTEQILKEFNPDVLIVFGTSIVKKNIFNIATFGTLNIHPGINPKYKGAGSFWALFNKDFDNYGFTIHLVDEGIDTGKIVSSKKINFNNNHKILPNMYVSLTKEAIQELIILLNLLIKNQKLSLNNPLTDEENYYTWLGLTDYIKMRLSLNDV